MVNIDTTEQYINPYNFIQLPKEYNEEPNKADREKTIKNIRTSINKVDYKELNGNLNGYIECELTTKTPTIIPAIENNGNKGFKNYQFFNYGNKNEIGNFIIPVIPGSEIRGMLRSDYEVFTNSCMSTLNEDMTFISRTKDIKLPGILKKGEDGNWELYEAKRYALHTCRKGSSRQCNGDSEAIYMVDDKNRIIIKEMVDGKEIKKIYKTGTLINFRYKSSNNPHLAPTVLEIEKGNNEGILFIGELGGLKKLNHIHDSIFVSSNNKIEVTDLNQSVKDLKAIYDMYNDKAFNQNIRRNGKTWYAGYDFNNKDGIPVWYSKPKKENNNKVYLSLAAIGKEAYHRTIRELVGDYMPCIEKTKVCKACNLFGFTAEKDAVGSKIRISDAIYEGNENPYREEMIIKELASPHIANACFYSLYAPNGNFINFPQSFDFNYDYKIEGQNKTEAIDLKDITIRGRKMYWHHDDIDNNVLKENQKDKNGKIIPVKTERNCSIIPVKDKIVFKFKIYFDKLRKEELDELIAVVNLNYENKKYKYDLCHKIGKAKPFGFGSCKLNVKNVMIKNISVLEGKLEYKMMDYNKFFELEKSKIEDNTLNKKFNMTTIPMKEALRIYDFNYIKNFYKDARVTYPIGEKEGKENSMIWFMNNKSDRLNDPYLIMVLPRIIDGKDENGEDGLKETEVKVKDKTIAKVHGLILPRLKR